MADSILSIEDFVNKLTSGELAEENLAAAVEAMEIKKVDEMRREISIYNTKPISGEGLLSFCLTNIREKYIKRMILSAYVGFIYRMNEEYKELRLEDEEVDEDTAKAEFEVIERFLDHFHKFNPDLHVRRATLKDVQNWDQYGRDKLFTTTADLPQEAFHKFNRYYEHNYEKHRMVVDDLFNERSDIEYAIMPMRVHNVGDMKENMANFKEFTRTFEADFPCDVHACPMGEWTFTGPFQKNRERIDFYNKNTAILQGIIEQSQQDSEIAKKLVEKRAKVKKQKNVDKAGPDAPGFVKHRQENRPNAEMLGVQHVSEIEKNPADRVIEEDGEIDSDDEDVPLDEVEIKVVKIGQGGRQFQKSRFTVSAEDNPDQQTGVFKPGVADAFQQICQNDGGGSGSSVVSGGGSGSK